MALERDAVPADDARRDDARLPRRRFLARSSTIAMGTGLTLGYGTLGSMFVAYLYPAQRREKGWRFVSAAASVATGASRVWTSPIGESVVIARVADHGDAADFVALSSTCPHLGCQVHWSASKARFLCPCHGGAFDSVGRPTAGPPFKAGQSLPRYPVKLEQGLLFVEVALESVAPGVGG